MTFPYSIALALGATLYAVGCEPSSPPNQSSSGRRAHKSEVAPIPTPADVVARMLEMASVTKDDVVWDLGSGDGRIVIAAAKTYGCRAVGFEIEPDLVALARDNVRKAHLEGSVTIEQQDIFTLDLSGATVVTLYLLPRLHKQLVPQLEKMRPGSRIVAHDFGIEGYKPDEVIRMESTEDGSRHTIYLFTTPLQKRADPG